MSMFHNKLIANRIKKSEASSLPLTMGMIAGREDLPREFIRKGMYEVSRVASLISELSYLKGCCGSEESDADLKSQIASLCDLLTKMVGEAKENLTADQVPAGSYAIGPRPY